MIPKPETFSFDRENTKELRDAYDTAVASDADRFVFHGHTLVVDYAKYLLQYLEGLKEADQVVPINHRRIA